MQTQALQTPPAQLELVEQKRLSWGNMGVNIHNQEMTFQARAQEALAKIATLPSTIEDVPAAELLLKEVKKAQATLQDDRKAITTKFDAVFARLMAPEKSFDTPLADYANAIISVKKKHEADQKAKQFKVDELKTIKQFILNKLIEHQAACDRKILEKINVAYAYALGDGNITPADLEVYIGKVSLKLTDEDFTPMRLKPNRQYATIEEVNALLNEFYVFDASAKTAEFIVSLEQKFSDYDVAFANKQDALALSQKQALESEIQIQNAQANAGIAVQLDIMTQTPEVQPVGVKALKKSYEVDMPETIESVMLIMAAFAANMPLCLPKLRVSKWFDLKPGQIATVLGKLKSEDNNFAPAGISFKEIDKL